MPSDTITAPSQDEQTISKRTAIACNRCRSRKTKCLARPPLPCSACKAAQAECVYTEAERRILVPESYLKELQTQASAERSVIDDPRRRPIHHGSERNEALTERSDNIDSCWFSGAQNIVLNRSSNPYSVGASSATHLAMRLNPTPSNLAWDAGEIFETSSLARPIKPTEYPLPPFELTRRLYDAQYAIIGTIFAFLEPDVYYQRLRQVYDQTLDFSDRESCLVYCQVMLVFAFGQMYSINQWVGNDGPPGFAYFKCALQSLPDVHEKGSVLFIEVLSYVAYFMQNLNRRDAALLYIGMALRMSLSLGLHEEVSSSTMSLQEREHRKQVWWSVYSLDRILCVRSGSPITIKDEDIGIPFSELALDPDMPRPWPRVVLGYYTQLSRILGRIGEEIYGKRRRSSSGLLASVQNIMDALSSWLQSVPDGLKVDIHSLNDHVNREAVSMFLHFYSCVMMTTRPLIFYVIQQRLATELQGSQPSSWKQDFSANIVAVIEYSITAARQTVCIMNAARKRDLISTYGYMDGEYAFSAALLLVMANAAFEHSNSTKTAMDQGLDVLLSMAERGNKHLKAQYLLLVSLQTAITPRRKRTYAEMEDDGTVGDLSSLSVPSQSPGIPTLPMVGQPLGQSPGDNVPFQPLSFDFNLNDDPRLWEEILGNIDIAMDTDWINSTLGRS